MQLCVAWHKSTPTQIGDSAGEEAELDLNRTKNKNTINSGAMDSDPKNSRDIYSDNIIHVEPKDLSDEQRLEMESALEEKMSEQRKLWLAGFHKTRNGAVNKVATPTIMPSASDLLGNEVKNPTKNLAHLIDASVARKFGSNMENQMHMLTKTMNDKF